jgi:hypothetical protein
MSEKKKKRVDPKKGPELPLIVGRISKGSPPPPPHKHKIPPIHQSDPFSSSSYFVLMAEYIIIFYPHFLVTDQNKKTPFLFYSEYK